jgi:resuscitation-promoting factor RpfB
LFLHRFIAHDWHPSSPAVLLLGVVVLLLACRPLAPDSLPLAPTPETLKTVILIANGETRSLPTNSKLVKDFLEENDIGIQPADIVEPEPDTSIPDASVNGQPFTVTVTRVTESIETIPERLSYSRQIIRSAEMSPDDPPRLLRAGQAGMEEVLVRIIYHNGLEVERWETSNRIIQPALDEIVMMGLESDLDEIPIHGTLAYIKDGRPVIWRGKTNQSVGLTINDQLDGRVFHLSPDGRYLLYTTGVSGPVNILEGFRNELWVIELRDSAEPRSLKVENVLWADWDPSAIDQLRFAYTTARTTSVPPGWEANNDLWIYDLAESAADQPAPVRLIENHATPYGWWGANYAWSQAGDMIAYAYASEVGLIEIPDPRQGGAPFSDLQTTLSKRTIIHTFQEFETGGDWAWVPSLSWSENSRFLAFGEHRRLEPPLDSQFNLALFDLEKGATTSIFENTGIWSAVYYSSHTAGDGDFLAYLHADEPEDLSTSRYNLWVAGPSGDNSRIIFPLGSETGQFSRANQSLAWGPDGVTIAFIYDDTLHLVNLINGNVFRGTADGTVAGTISWAPYGSAADE